MTDFLQSPRIYKEAEKFRCVARATVFPESIKEQVRLRYFAHLSMPAFEKYWRSKVGHMATVVETGESLTRNFCYLFKEAAPPYVEGRFNTENFPVLYTAKNPETARTERFHYVDADAPFDFVIYSVSANGKVADLRPFEERGELVIGEDHGPCREIAAKLLGRCSGVAWNSVRLEGGACCAFFSCDEVKAGVVVEEGTFEPPTAT